MEKLKNREREQARERHRKKLKGNGVPGRAGRRITSFREPYR